MSSDRKRFPLRIGSTLMPPGFGIKGIDDDYEPGIHATWVEDVPAPSQEEGVPESIRYGHTACGMKVELGQEYQKYDLTGKTSPVTCEKCLTAMARPADMRRE